jgi:1-acyl-sn-glycerol-3-phosphate acyltransferase
MNHFYSQLSRSVGSTSRLDVAHADALGGPLLLRIAGALGALHRAGPVSLAEQAERLSKLCGWICQLHGIDVEVRGRSPEAPVIIVANHLGYVDPLVLCSLFRCSPIAKSEIERWAVVGEPLRRLNVNFVRRGSPHSGARTLLRCLRTLRAGVSVLNFPEGTTSRGKLLPFHVGAFWLARHSRLPVVPVGVDFEDLGLCWVDDEAFLPHYARLCWSQRRWRVRVCIGDPLDPASFDSDVALSCAAQSSIARMRAPYPAASAWST